MCIGAGTTRTAAKSRVVRVQIALRANYMLPRYDLGLWCLLC